MCTSIKFVSAACFWAVSVAAWGGTIVGPTPYVSLADRPAGFFDGIGADSLICLENFEGAAVHGYSIDFGSRIGPKTISGDGVSVTDSVDGDDGAIDGDGVMGSSWFSGVARQLTITFAEVTQAAGFVLTDADSRATKLRVEAFDAAGQLICDESIDRFWDSVFTGTTGEDRFIGLSATAGIKRLRISLDQGQGLEIDHLQFVKPVPEPATFGLLAVAWLGIMGTQRRRR